MEYKSVTIYNDVDKKFFKAEVQTDLGKIEVTDIEKLNKILSEFATQNEITLDELLKKDDLVKKVVIKKEKTTSSTDLKDEEKDEIVFSSSKTKKSKKTKKKSGFVKKLLVGGALVVVLGTGAYHLDKFHNVFNGKLVKFLNPNKKIEFIVDNNKKDDVVITNNGQFTIVDTGNKNNDSEYDETMEKVIEEQDKTNDVISKLDEKVVEMSKEEILETLNNNARIANSSIFELSQFINGKDLAGSAYYFNFESNFTQGSYDYNAVKVFSDMRNAALKAAYEEKNIDKAKSIIRDFYSLYAEVVTLDKRCNVGNLVVDFSELSDIAKATVLELGVAMLEIYLPNYEYEVDGKTLSKEKILENAVETLQGELIPTLIDKGYRK